MSEQLVFDLPTRQSHGRDAFFVSGANAQAVQMLDDTAAWPMGKMILIGPEGSGKTHLAEIWAGETGAMFGTQFDADTPPHTPCVVEDADQIAGDMTAETALFHLHNHLREQGLPLLITARTPVRDWGLTLPDLQSRMMATTNVAIAPPDDTLLQAVMVKQFSDRQLSPPPNLIPYILDRVDRSFAAVQDVVARLDALSLQTGQKITRQMAAQILATDQREIA